MALGRFLADNLESIAWSASAGVAGCGAAALLLVLGRWRWVEPYYREFIAKVAVALFRAVAAAAAIAGKSSAAATGATTDQPWAGTMTVAVAGYLLWEITGAVGDHKFKQAKDRKATDRQREIDALTQDREDAELEATRLNWLLAHLRELVSQKLQRVRQAIRQSAGARASIQQARDGLAPDEQIRMILESLASLFRIDVVSTGGNYAQNFRVGLYVESDGRLRPLDAFDLATKRHTPFLSPDAHADRFRLDNADNPSHAVRCVLEGRTLVVPDCGSDPDFEYFHDLQRNYLKSLVAYPLADCCPDGTSHVRAALVIDTDVPGYFRAADREMIESRVKEFVVRIDLEYAFRRLTG